MTRSEWDAVRLLAQTRGRATEVARHRAIRSKDRWDRGHWFRVLRHVRELEG